ncbi:hypothetical protein GCM10008959_25840 [Deinococcus seoulensis]|uniref:Uncharacterized protein n=1 Tax=Deinococcus seoulensis TaxID=1837379 RepID=A0ABQ2RSF0_9DEIO|nr:hypothetical protein [Deinococcus seoulensis]GGR62639.1 hypothetical protein GCM10008959_25840 [Deinococcus seoulensis]
MTTHPAPVTTVPVYAAHERRAARPSRLVRRWRVFRRRELPFALAGLGMVSVLALTISVVLVEGPTRLLSAAGLIAGVLLFVRALYAAPGPIREYVDLPGGRQ